MADGGGFVGRLGELTLLKEGLTEAFDGRGRLFLLSGEPGVGKTRLADEFAGYARQQGARVVWGRCWEGARAPAYWPWVRAIRSLLRDYDSERLLELMGSGGSDLAQILPELHTRFPDLPPLPSRDAESARFQLFDSTADFLSRAARAQPIVLVLDDIHSADTPSLLFLRFFAGELANARIVLIAIYRDGELTPDHPLAAVVSQISREPATREIRMVGLNEPEVAELVEAATQMEPDPGLVSRLFRDTTGNPLYLEETIRLHATEGRLDNLAEVELLHLTVPARISDLMLRRVSQSSDLCAGALRLASVLGAEFSIEVLRRLGRYSYQEMIDILDEAEDAQLVLRSVDPSYTLAFSHDLIRQSLYRSLSESKRVALHAEAATVLESSYGKDVQSHLAELAHHFFEAAPGGYADRAVEYARLAGADAASSLAYEEAVRLHTMALTALEMLPSFDETMRVAILLDIGDALTRAAEDARAKETFHTAAGIAKRIGEAGQLARAALGYGGIFVWTRAGGDRELVPLLQDALLMLGGADDRLRVRLLSRLACALRDSPDRETSDVLSAEAVRTARGLDDPDTLCYALEGRIAAVMWPENPQERLDMARELIGIAEREDQFERMVAGRVFEIAALCDLGLIAEARNGVETLAREAERLRQPNRMFIAEINRTEIELLQGRFLDAEEGIASALERFSARDEYSVPRFHMFLLRREQGRLAEIEEFVRESVREFPWYPVHRTALICLLAEIQRDREARQLFDEMAADGFRMLNRDCEWLLGMSLASEACFLLGALHGAESLYEQILPFAGRHAVGWAEGSVGAVDRYLGLLASVLNRPDDAVGHFQDAIELNKAMGARPWTAHCQHDYGRVLLDRDAPGDRELADNLFASAGSTAKELGMTALLAKLAPVAGRRDTAASPPEGGRHGVFRREGDYWSLSFAGEPFRLRDLKGLRYLAQLLASPDKEIHVLDLAGARASDRGAAVEGLAVGGLGDAGDLSDNRARAAYRERIKVLAEDLQQAEAWNDTERATTVREEMAFIAQELTASQSLGGASRKTGSASERARVNVTRAIRTAIARIEEYDPDLNRHLDTTVRTGTFCSYRPDPQIPVDWRF